ncbi:MAG: 2TM domain-containing protein [Verrucomicrobiota bacterium]
MTEEDQELREFAIRRLERRRKFFADLGSYVAVNAVLWLVWAIFDRSVDGLPWPAWVSIIWGCFLLLDGLRLLRTWGRLGRPITEADIEREIHRIGGTGPA